MVTYTSSHDPGNNKQLVQEASELAREILDLVDELPETAEDFVHSVSENALGILEWIQDHDIVTNNQMVALENMRKGIYKWLKT